ncbi:18288_t:CDS:2 [Entrophospora sp. SA101]|nr:8928_t:CDS:2 [Entrophospora sp. SA101]CAJ0747154.1 18288_t:CDS:2 [Entrophospora sp. SA101]
MVQELNESLNLNLKEPDFKQVIKRIQELISKPPIAITDENTIESLETELNEARQTAKKLEKELTGTNSSVEKDLVNIAETTCQALEKILPESAYLSVREEIQQATSYQQIVQAQKKALDGYLAKNVQLPVMAQPQKELIPQPNQERIILISCLVASLLTVGGLLMKLKKAKKNQFTKNGNKVKEIDFFAIIERLLNELMTNQDIELKTAPEYVIGYIVRELRNKDLSLLTEQPAEKRKIANRHKHSPVAEN